MSYSPPLAGIPTPPSAQRADGYFDFATTLNVVRHEGGHPCVEQFVRAGHARVTVASQVRADYAARPGLPQARAPVWMAGGKSLHRLDERGPGVFDAEAVADALGELLVVVDRCLLGAQPCEVGGVPFPHLAFAEFIEALLLAPAQVIARAATDTTVEVVGGDVFDIGEGYEDVMRLMLARDWKGFVFEIGHRFTDPVWAAMHRSRYPGHAELFLSSIRRRRAEKVAA